MKAVVLEVKNKYAAILNSDGTISKVINRNYVIGQEIYIYSAKKKYAAIASIAAVFVLLFSISAFAYFTPYTYVSVDVNPSFEFSVNRFDRVINVKAVNGDGTDILKKIDTGRINHKKITDAVVETIKGVKENGYFDEENQVLITTSNKNEKKAIKLANELQDETRKEVTKESVTIETMSVGKERVKQAKDIGITPGKLNLIEKLKDVSDNPDFDIEEWKDKSVKEIVTATKEMDDIDEEAEQQKNNINNEKKKLEKEYKENQKRIEKEKKEIEKEIEKEQKEKEKAVSEIEKNDEISSEEKEKKKQELEEKFEEKKKEKEQKQKELEDKKADKEKEKEEKQKELDEKLEQKEKEKEEKKKEIEEKSKDKKNNGNNGNNGNNNKK